MATTTWTSGAAGSGLYFEIVYDGETGLISVNMLEGSMDLNALYVSDGDKSVEGDGTTLAKKDSSLNMNGSGETWDDMVVLNSAGLGGADQASYFLKAGDSYTLTEAQMTSLLGTLWESESDDLSELTIGVRATSVNGGGSIKAVASDGVYDAGGDDGDGDGDGDGGGGGGGGGGFISVSGKAGAVWLDTDKDGDLDAGETELFVDAENVIHYGSDTGTKVDFTDGDWTVEFWDVLGKTVDLTGFAAGDEVIVNMAKWTGMGEASAAFYMGYTNFNAPTHAWSGIKDTSQSQDIQFGALFHDTDFGRTKLEVGLRGSILGWSNAEGGTINLNDLGVTGPTGYTYGILADGFGSDSKLSFVLPVVTDVADVQPNLILNPLPA